MWKPIENYNSLYEVNEKGEIRSLYHWNGHKYEKRKKPYILKQTNTTTGYKKVELAKKYNCSNMLIATRKYQLKKGRI